MFNNVYLQAEFHIQIPVSALYFLALPTNIDVDCLSTDNPEATDQQKEDTPIYEKHNQLVHGDNTGKSKPLKYRIHIIITNFV